MKIQSAIIYAALTAITPQHRILLPTERFGDVVHPKAGKELWIRMETVNADAGHALDMAQPMEGETVLGSVELK